MNLKQLKEVKINFNNQAWNPEKHSLILKYDPKSKLGFKVDIIPVYHEPEIVDMTLAGIILKKFTK